MTTGGLIVMTVSAGGATLFFIICIYKVLKALENDKAVARDIGEDVNIESEAERGGSNEASGN